MFIIKSIILQALKIYWRLKNRHNFTILKNKFDFNKVSVGKFTYGDLNVLSWGSKNEELRIGSFVSIASNVKFILGGNHYYKSFSTYPFKVKLKLSKLEATSKGPIYVQDDVWIGTNSIILSGVTISKGSIIAAGSIVTKSTLPYSIVGGNPAKFIKYRFDLETINRILNKDYSKINLNYLKRNISLISEDLSKLSQEEIDKIFDINE